MLITVRRHWFTETSTSGTYAVDGTITGYTLEDVARPDGVKIPGKTCIPAGEYPVIIDFSQRFQREMPHVLNVPLFTGVRIHAGNTDADTEGCILVGQRRDPDAIWESRLSFDALFEKMKAAVARGETICLEIKNEPL